MADNHELEQLLQEAMDNVTFEEDTDEDIGTLMKTAESLIQRSYSLAEYTDHAKLAYAFLTSYGLHKEVTLIRDDAPDLNSAMITYTDDELPSYPEFEQAFNESGKLVMGIACFDLEDRDRYGLFITPCEDPILTVYCEVMDEDMDCLFAELDQKYWDLMEGIERDKSGNML